MYIYIIYILYVQEQMRKVDDNDNSLYKHDWFI